MCLVSSAGLGSEVSVALRQMTVPGVGEAAIWWGQTGIGAAQRLLVRLPLLFTNPACVPQPWLTEQYRLAQLPGFLDTTLAEPSPAPTDADSIMPERSFRYATVTGPKFN